MPLNSSFRRRQYCVGLGCLLTLFLLNVLLQSTVYFQQLRWSAGISEKTHMFVISAFYYHNSKSLPNNTIAVLFSSKKLIKEFPVMCASVNALNQSMLSVPNTFQALMAPLQCKWTVRVALCPVVNAPVNLRLVAPSTAISKTIKFAEADKTPRNFLVCMSRMFLFENWQLLVSSMEIYRYYGADTVVTYVMSVAHHIHLLMKAYEREGVLLIKPGVQFFQPEDMDYDPNVESQWNNQDTTYNSCLYEFKDSAEFMLIADWDDILIPKHHGTYLEELRWLQQLHPTGASFIFTRPRTTLHAARSPNQFDLATTLGTLWVNESHLETGKHVSMPSKIGGTWFHEPTHVADGWKMVWLEPTATQTLHFRKWKYYDEQPRYENRSISLITNSVQIGNNFASFLKRHDMTEIFNSFPSTLTYYPLMVECYEAFGRRLHTHTVNTCPSVPDCDLPETVPLKCVSYKPRYKTAALLNGFVIHQMDGDTFVVSEDGCR